MSTGHQTVFGYQIEGFRESLKIRKRSRETIVSYLYWVEKFLGWIMEQKIYDIREITYETIWEYQVYVSSKGYSIWTVHLLLRSLKRFFEYLEKRQNLLINPAEKITFPKVGDRLPRDIPSEEEMKRLLEAPNTSIPLGIRDRALLEVLYSTGIRRNECRNLKVYDVDYKGGYVRINQGKGSKDRMVPLGKKACEYVREYLLKIRPRLEKNDERSLFVSQLGGSLSNQMVNLIVKKYARKAKIARPVTVHSIRRACATHLLRNSAHPLYIQRLLGHATSGTLNKYIKVTGLEVKKTHKRTHPRERDRR